MLKLIIGMLLVIIIFVSVEYVITNTLSETATITIADKYTDGDLYCIKTISLEQYCMTKSVYDQLESGNTYIVKIYMNRITEVIEWYPTGNY